MSRLLNYLVIAITIVAVSFSVLSCNSGKKGDYNKEGFKGGASPKDAPPVPVYGLVVSKQEVDNKIDVIGTILPNEKVDLKSEASGRITDILFKEDAKVHKGDLLVKIFNADLQAQLKKIRIQQELAKKDASRNQQLLAINGVSQQIYDASENQVEALGADADLIEAQIRKTEIRAPFDGIIGLRYVSEGEYLAPTTLIATIQQIDPIKLEFDIPEKYSSNVNKGSTIDFTVTGMDKVYKGKVYATEPMIDITTRTLKVRAHCSNEDFSLKPGAFIRIELLLNQDKNAILVPTEAIVPGLTSQKVFVYNNGKAFSRKVLTGTRNASSIQITDGLEINDTVITSGIMQLKDSVRVKLNLNNPQGNI